MPSPPNTPKDFIGVLENVWWRLDAALDDEMIYWSAKLGAVEALMAGTTCIIDHHESPNAISGSLALITQACNEVGVRVNASYGVTDRWTDTGSIRQHVKPAEEMTAAARAGLEENRRHLASGGRGMVGVHASFTATDDTLVAAANLAQEFGVGVHIHVAEGPDDAGAHSRLAELATEKWLIVHGVHLRQPLKGTLVHNPRSNMNNAVGYAHPTRLECRSLSARTVSVQTCQRKRAWHSRDSGSLISLQVPTRLVVGSTLDDCCSQRQTTTS